MVSFNSDAFRDAVNKAGFDSLDAFAREMGVARATLFRYVQYGAMPIERLRKALEVLHVPLEAVCDSQPHTPAVKRSLHSPRRLLNVMLDEGAYMPERAHATDAGLDLRSRTNVTVHPFSSSVIDTGVHVRIPAGHAGLLVSKSGLNVNFDITSTGLIDEGYTGSIRVKLYNHGDRPRKISRGDKISQLTIIPVSYLKPNLVTSFPKTERGDGGFGSTGR